MIKRIVTGLFFAALFSYSVQSQTNWYDNIQVNGFIQTEFEWSQWEGKTNNGQRQTYDGKRDGVDNDYFLRYGVRRGGIRLAYEKGITTGVFELDLNDGGLYPKAALIQIHPTAWIEINAGLQTVWFGSEVPYPTPKQEVLEHCDLLRNLFFLDRDIGLKISLKSPTDWVTNGLRFDFGFVSGNNINKIQDGKMNFVGHLKYERTVNDVYFGLGTSVFVGKVHNMYKELNIAGSTLTIPTSYADVFTEEENPSRTYFDIEAQCRFQTTLLGTTELKGEYVWGTHPSQMTSLRSPNNNEYSDNVKDAFCLSRHFGGGYIYAFQDLGSLPVRLLFKYTWSNPDNEITSADKQYACDVNTQTFGLGCQWKISQGLTLTGIFDINSNEKCNNLPAYNYDRKDNHFTMRLQYEF